MDGTRQRAVDFHFRIRHHTLEDNAHLAVVPFRRNLEGSAIEAVFVTGHRSLFEVIASEGVFPEAL